MSLTSFSASLRALGALYYSMPDRIGFDGSLSRARRRRFAHADGVAARGQRRLESLVVRGQLKRTGVRRG